MRHMKKATATVLTSLMIFISQPLLADVQQSLSQLKQEAINSHSDSLLVIHNGEVLAEHYTDDGLYPIELMSAFKSVVSLAVGRLISQGKIKSLDQPVFDFYPQWKQGRKQLITIRHLLNHTSGLQNVANAGEEIYPSPDAIKLALAAELTTEPGAAFSYNNKATNLLAGIVQQASGLRLDQYLVAEFFTPMGIEHYKFYYDRSGNPHGMAGLQLLAADFAKFGTLVLNNGRWHDEQLVSADYISDMLAAGQVFNEHCGLLWWRMPRTNNQPDAFYADGFLGQYLVIVPEKGLVAVRQIKRTDSYRQDTDLFAEFRTLVAQLAAELPVTSTPEKQP